MGFFIGINIIMASLYNADLKPLESGTYTHYYDHATRLFLADNFRLAPKQSFLYYVCINVDQSILQSLLGGLGQDPVSSQSLIEQYETGLLAKRVQLPGFNIGTKTLNAYNRKNIVQTAINYDPLTITFHDDAADVVTTFWNDYYSFYYRDSDYQEALYTMSHKYTPRQREGWGYTPRNGNLKNFIRSIQIFSLHNKRFTEYLIINPFITNWKHGEHNSAEGNGIMENQMTVTYETVKYRTGYVNPVDVNGFATIHYDNFNSPISNSITNIYTDGGLIGALANGPKDLARPDGTGSGKGLLGSILDAYRFYNNVKDVNFKAVGSNILGQIGVNLVNQAINSTAAAVFPTLGYGSATVYQSNTLPASLYANPGSSSAVTIANRAVGQVIGAGVSAITNPIQAGINAFTQGVTTTVAGVTNAATSAIYRVFDSGNNISIDARTGQPVTGQSTAYVVDAGTGAILSQFSVPGTQGGGYTGNDNVVTNLRNITTATDQNGIVVNTYQFQNGDILVKNQEGETVNFVPGSYTNPSNFNTNPTSAATLAAQGLPVTAGVQYGRTSSGLIYTAGGTTGATFTNTVAGALGGAAGLYAGQAIYQGSQKLFGTSLLGQTVSAAVSGVAGAAVGQVVNNIVQPISNALVGSVSQAWDSVTGSIKNVMGSFSGTGGYLASDPSKNIVSTVLSGNTQTNTLANGDLVTIDLTTGAQSITAGASAGGLFNSGLFSNYSTSTLGQSTDNSSLTSGWFGTTNLVTSDGSQVYFGDPSFQSGGASLISGGYDQAYYDQLNLYY